VILISAYPAWFQVSSGSFTRACAAGRPSIVGDCGALAERVVRNKCGRVYKTGCASALSELFVAIKGAQEKGQYMVWSANAAQLGLSSTLGAYGDQIVGSYGIAQSHFKL